MPRTNSYWMSNEEYKLVTKLTPIPTVNLVILRGQKKEREVILIVRKTGYAKGRWCMIGGRVWKKETLEHTIERHVKDLGVKIRILPPFNSNFPSFIDDRKTQDETKHPISIIYPAEITSGRVREEGEEYQGFKWFPVNKLPKIAYGQKLQIQKTIEQLKKFDKI